MTDVTHGLVRRSTFGLISLFRVPLFREEYLLIPGSAALSGIGLVYWVLACRLYTTESVGISLVVILTVMFLATFSLFGLPNALSCFRPRAGSVTGWMVVRAYLTGVATVLASSLIFLYSARIWTPTRRVLESDPYFVPGFAVAATTWSILVLQERVISGLKYPSPFPATRVIFTFSGITLLVGFVSILPDSGIVASWAIASAVVILPANLLIFRSLVPAHGRAEEEQNQQVVPPGTTLSAVGDRAASVIAMFPLFALPLLVLERLGAASTAYYIVAWAVAYSLHLVSQNMSLAVTARSGRDPAKFITCSYRAFVRSGRLVVPLAVVLATGAPFLLRAFGRDYSLEGTLLLRLVCLSAIPHVTIASYFGIVRAQRRMRGFILVVTLMSVLLLSLGYLFLGTYGLNGIGLAWLLSQTVVAAVLLVAVLCRLWLPCIDVRTVLRVVAVPRSLAWRLSQYRIKAGSARLLPAILPRVSSPENTPDPAGWCIQGRRRTVNDVAVLTLGPQGQPPAALLKLPQSGSAVASLKRHREVLASLHADERLGPWRALLPVVLAEGKTGENYYLVEQRLSGVDARTLLHDSGSEDRLRAAATRVIGLLHRRTATPLVVDAGVLQRWVDQPCSRIKATLERSRPSRDYIPTLEDLGNELKGTLAGKRLAVSWVHGDFTPGNILVTRDTGVVAGILDWDQAARAGVPQLDLVMLFLSMRMLKRRCELGDVVGKMLGGAGWTSGELELLNAAQEWLPGEAAGMRELVLLAWLHHVEANLSKSIRYLGHSLWTAKNIEAVLLCL